MNNREQDILGKVTEVLKTSLNYQEIILFGSRAKENGSAHADFDIAVNCVKPDIGMQRKITEEIEKVSGLYSVDIVYLLSVDEDFRQIVLKTGKVIYEGRT